jgi:hypothetical protein
MSPSESDLRAALHDGEDSGGLNVDHLIVHAQAAGAQHRQRLLSGAMITAVVLGSGVGIGFLTTHHSSESAANNGAAANAGGGQALRRSSDYGDAAGKSAQAPVSGLRNDVAHGTAASSVPCPTTVPKYELPGGGGLTQFGADGQLFSKPVRYVLVCAYAEGKQSGRLALSGAPAKDLAAGLEAAPKTPLASPLCRGASGTRSLALLAYAADGSAAGRVTATFPTCGSMVTNGTAVRYDWTPPTSVQKLLGR